MNASQSPHNEPENQGQPFEQRLSIKAFDTLYADGLDAMRLCDYGEAETALGLAYEVAQKGFSPGDPRIFQSLEAYAKACESNQKSSLHESLLSELIQISQKYRYYDYLISGTVNLAVVKIENKEYDEGCHLAEKALEISAQQKEQHPVLPACHFICALANLHQEKYQIGFGYIAAGFYALETQDGRDTSQATKLMLGELSSLLTHKLMYADARRCALKLIELHEENSATEHVNTYIRALQLVAEIDSFFGQSSKAAAGYRRVLDLLDGVDAGSLPRAMKYLYGRQLLNCGRVEESIEVFTKSIDDAIENPATTDEREFIDLKLALASAYREKGSLQEAYQMLQRTEIDLCSRLPEEIAELVIERPQDIGEELGALVYDDDFNNVKRQQIISDLKNITTTSHLLAQLEHARRGDEAMAQMMTRVHALSDVLSSAGAQPHIEFLKMTITDPDPSDSKLDFLEDALSAPKNLSAYEELGLRCLAAGQYFDQERDDLGRVHLSKAHHLYNLLLAGTDSIEHGGLILSYAGTCARCGENERAISALEHLVGIFDSTDIDTNRNYIEALIRLAALYEQTDEGRGDEMKRRALTAQRKLVLNNPDFFTELGASEE